MPHGFYGNCDLRGEDFNITSSRVTKIPISTFNQIKQFFLWQQLLTFGTYSFGTSFSMAERSLWWSSSIWTASLSNFSFQYVSLFLRFFLAFLYWFNWTAISSLFRYLLLYFGWIPIRFSLRWCFTLCNLSSLPSL